jgi:hypothetical protein
MQAHPSPRSGPESSGPPSTAHLLSNPADVERAADAVAAGAMVAHGFANFYVIVSRPDAATVRVINIRKGRPPDQVGSVTTTPLRAPLLFDWFRLPAGLTKHTVLGLMDALFERGPFGFRGPAAPGVPEHLTYVDEGVRTAQLIAPGYACPSNHFLARALDRLDEDLLYITSANRSRHLTGADDEPAHYLAEGIEDEFGGSGDLFVLRHPDEAAARRRYPRYAPLSTTLLGFHRVVPGPQGEPCLVVERHGSLPVDEFREVVARFGFGLVLGPRARQRLLQRQYRGQAGTL